MNNLNILTISLLALGIGSFSCIENLKKILKKRMGNRLYR